MEIDKLRIFLKPQPVEIFSRISSDKGYYPGLHRDLNCTDCQMALVLRKFEAAELITIEKKGRRKIIKMTEKGKIIADTLKNLVE